MTLIERCQAARKRISDGHAPMRIPADMTDADIVLADCEMELERLSAQVVELQKDAKRYKFLKKQNDEPSCTMGIWAEIDSGTEYPGEEVVDIWIDRRIEAANPVHSTVTRASVPPKR